MLNEQGGAPHCALDWPAGRLIGRLRGPCANLIYFSWGLLALVRGCLWPVRMNETFPTGRVS